VGTAKRRRGTEVLPKRLKLLELLAICIDLVLELLGSPPTIWVVREEEVSDSAVVVAHFDAKSQTDELAMRA
jgi:hypothetical protein